jgi:hypothetical protein
MIRYTTIDKSSVYLFGPFCTLLNITQGYSGLLTTVTMLLGIEEGRGQCVHFSSLEIYSRMCSAALFPDEPFLLAMRRSIYLISFCVCEGGGG